MKKNSSEKKRKGGYRATKRLHRKEEKNERR